MSVPEKPFSCMKAGCGESFTNEDRLSVHVKKHDMELELGSKAESFVADQTPTPTRFIRNCEEVGLFQDLQNVNVNPFEETFKRAIESRSNLNIENSLIVGNPDDTLHTPHIFPNLSEDNGTGIYSGNNDTERTLKVQRSSSDESSNHLSVVRCLTSSLDVDIPQVGNCDKNKLSNDHKTIRKTFSSSKVKLRRQESIDLPDEISEVEILEPLNHPKSDNVGLRTGVEVITQNNQGRSLQIPVISISESEGNSKGKLIKEKKTQTNVHDPVVRARSKEQYLNVDSCIKTNYAKLISQKSIEMALANFTNEAQNKLLDLNNISIEDIPESASIIREHTKTESEPLEDHSHLGTAQARPLVLMQNCDKGKKRECVDKPQDKPTKSTTGVPVIEINNSVSSVDVKKGYELIVKWPDGKQIYLKEIKKEAGETDTMATSSLELNQQNSTTDTETLKSNIKRKLKDMLTTNSKKVAISKTPQNNATVYNSFPVVIPDKYIIVPQMISEPKIPVISTNLNILPMMSQPQMNRSCQLQSVPIPNKTQPVIRTVLNGKICEGTTSLLPVPITAPVAILEKKSKIINTANASSATKQQAGGKANILMKTSGSGKKVEMDPIEIKKNGNRAAVLRYRLKGKQRQKMLIEKNEMLEKTNLELTEKLRLATIEINYLRSKLGHAVLTPVITSENHVLFSQSANLSKEKPAVIFKRSS